MTKCSIIYRFLRVSLFVMAISQAALAQNAEAPTAITLTLPDGSKTTLAPGTIIRIRRAIPPETQSGAKTRIDWLQLLLVRELPEDVAALVEQSVPSLAKLKMPEGSPIWFNAGVAQGPMPLTPDQLKNGVHSGIVLGDKLQFLASTPEEVREELSDKGGNALPEPQAVASLSVQGLKALKQTQKAKEAAQEAPQAAQPQPQQAAPVAPAVQPQPQQAVPVAQAVQPQPQQAVPVAQAVQFQQPVVPVAQADQPQQQPAPKVAQLIPAQDQPVPQVGQIIRLQQDQPQLAGQIIRPPLAQALPVGQIIRLQQDQPEQQAAAPIIVPQPAPAAQVGQIIRIQRDQPEQAPQPTRIQQAQAPQVGQIIRIQQDQPERAAEIVHSQQAQAPQVGQIIRIQQEPEQPAQVVRPQQEQRQQPPPQEQPIEQAQDESGSSDRADQTPRKSPWFFDLMETAEQTSPFGAQERGRPTAKQAQRTAEEAAQLLRTSRGLKPPAKKLVVPTGVWDAELLDSLKPGPQH